MEIRVETMLKWLLAKLEETKQEQVEGRNLLEIYGLTCAKAIGMLEVRSCTDNLQSTEAYLLNCIDKMKGEENES